MTNPRKKIRADAAENRLSVAEREELDALVAANCPLSELRAWFAAHTGSEIGLGTASRIHARRRTAADRLLKRNLAIAATRKAATEAGTTLTAAAVEEVAIAVGDIIDAIADPDSPEGRSLLISALPALTGARQAEIAADRVQTHKAALKLAERKVVILERRLADAKQVVESSKLTPEQQRARLREIFAK